MRPRIAIVNSSSFGKVFPQHVSELNRFADIERLTLPPSSSPAEIRQQLREFHALISGTSPSYTSAVLEGLSNLVVITECGVRHDNVDIHSCTKNNIIVTSATGRVERTAIAEHAIALLLAAGRKLFQGENAVKSGRFADRSELIGVQLNSLTVGIIGLGNVGTTTARILSAGFQSNVIAYDPYSDESKFQECGAKRYELSELLERSHAIILQCALSSETESIMSHNAFSKMKAGTILVNTSRAELVDESALSDAIHGGTISAYATDVIRDETQTEKHPLLKHPEVLIVPRLGEHTYTYLKAVGDLVLEDLRVVFHEKRAPEGALNGGDVVVRW